MSRVKTPTYLQMEAVECGAAALGAVLGYHGRWEPLEELRALCGVSRDGSNAANIVAAARRFGFEARGFRKEIPSLRDVALPAILHWEFNHFVVLEGFSRNKVHINDPASGRRTVPLETLDRSFTGVVLTFDRTDAFTPAGRPFSASRSLVARLKHSLPTLAFAVAAGLAATVPAIALAILLKTFVDAVLVQGRSSWATTIVIGVVTVGLIQLVATYLQSEVLVRLASKLSVTWTTGALWHVLRLPMRFFLQRQPGDVAQRISAASRLAQLTANQGVLSAINTVSALVFLVVMVRTDILLAAVVLAFGLLSFGAARLVYDRNTATNQHLLAEVGKLQSVAVGGLFDIETLKASGREGDFFGRWAGQHARVLNATAAFSLRGVVLAGVPTLVTAMSTAAVLIIGGLRVIDDALTIGQLFAFQSLAVSFNGPIQRLVALTTQLQQAEGQMRRIDDLMRHEPDPAATRPSGGGDAPLAGAVTLDRVTFGYSPLAEPVIRDVTIHLEPGSRVAIVGGTGSGKSTIAKLVCGLYEPWEGQILFDGRPRSTLATSTLAAGLALVDQEVLLFAGSVRDNLSLWDPTVTDDDLVAAARDACIHDDIARRPDAYAAPLEENGRNFSGGQRQRLELARALVTDPAILVLDEATSALDPETELLIDDALRRRGATCVIVAHRLSTIRDCDEIIVLERGKIVERGTHDDLLAADGAYARLARGVA